MRNEAEVCRALKRYADTVRRICLLHLKNRSDVEDVFQDVFLKYVLHDAIFESEAHEKAWLIRVTVNACKDVFKSFFRKRVVSLDSMTMEASCFDEAEKGLLEAVFRLPDQYRDVIYLFYYEGYSAIEIAGMLEKKVNTVYTWLDRARKTLKSELRGEWIG